MKTKKRAITLHFKEGDEIYSKANGFGVIKRVDAESEDFPYYAVFKNGTKMWYRATDTVPASKAPKSEASEVKADP